MSRDKFVDLDELEAHGFTVANVRQSCPGAIEYTDWDGRPFWRREQLEALIGPSDAEDQS